MGTRKENSLVSGENSSWEFNTRNVAFITEFKTSLVNGEGFLLINF